MLGIHRCFQTMHFFTKEGYFQWFPQFASGAKSSINVWDLNQEIIASNIQTHSDTHFTSMVSSQHVFFEFVKFIG